MPRTEKQHAATEEYAQARRAQFGLVKPAQPVEAPKGGCTVCHEPTCTTFGKYCKAHRYESRTAIQHRRSKAQKARQQQYNPWRGDPLPKPPKSASGAAWWAKPMSRAEFYVEAKNHEASMNAAQNNYAKPILE